MNIRVLLSVAVYQFLLLTGNASNITCNYTWTSSCRCGFTSNVVICDDNSLQVNVLKCYCMTYSRLHNTTVVGSCMYTCKPYKQHGDIYYRIPKSLQALNNATCGRHNRKEQMCSHCRETYAPSVYSYDYYCTECSEYEYNWVKYLLIAYLPLTLFYVVTLCFKISITRSSLYAHVLLSQLMSTTQVASLLDIRRPHILTDASRSRSVQVAIFKSAFTIYGIWNLDFG